MWSRTRALPGPGRAKGQLAQARPAQQAQTNLRYTDIVARRWHRDLARGEVG
jgi:hypothetical protein